MEGKCTHTIIAMDMKNLTEVTSEPLLRASSSASKRPWQLISSNSCVLSILKPLDLMICDHTCEWVMSLRTQQRLTISTLSITSSYNAAHLVPTPSAELPSSIWVCHYCMTLSAVMGQNLFNSVIAFWKRAMKNAPNQIWIWESKSMMECKCKKNSRTVMSAGG